MAQFIIGFSETVPDHDLSDSDFIDGLKVAVKKVYGALSHPVEGTMITVMRLWVDEVDTLYKNSNDFKKAIHASLNKAYAVLKDTPNLLLVLKEHHVVDSGAKGFVHFIEGFIKGLYTTEKIKIEESTEDLEYETHFHETDEVITHRYCTEALVHTSLDASDEIRSTLEALGDSLLMVKSRNYLKIHLHTNTPNKLMEALRPLGPIIQQKADDMILQHKDLSPKTRIALLTDSIADIPQSLIDEAQIHVYPLTILIDEAPYLDRLTMPSSTFYDQLSQFKKYPSSSQPSLRSIQDIYKNLLEHYDQVLVVSVSSKMSGTYQVFMKATEGLEDKVVVVDSKQNSGAQGLLVNLANQWIQEGLPIETIKEKLEEASRNTKIFVSVDTLKYMVKMGRIPPVLGKVGKWINMKPIVTIDSEGHGKTMGSAFSKKQTEKRMIKEVLKMTQEKKLINYCIVHGNDSDRAQRFSEILTQKLNKAPLYIEEVSSIVAMSAGPKTFAIALHVEDLV
jgi:DegV family protein with EDD domain